LGYQNALIIYNIFYHLKLQIETKAKKVEQLTKNRKEYTPDLLRTLSNDLNIIKKISLKGLEDIFVPKKTLE